MSSETISIRSHHGSKSAVEKAAQVIFTACGFFAVLAVASIALYTKILERTGKYCRKIHVTLWSPSFHKLIAR